MPRIDRRLGVAGLAAVALALAPLARAQAAPPPAAKPPGRVILVANVAWWPSGAGFGDTRTFAEYAEQTTIRTSHEAGSGFGPDLAAQVSLFGGLGLLVGYSAATRDLSGTVDVARPHPLYLDQPRSASAETSGYELSERAVHLDVAFARAAGTLDWALFAGATLFEVKADLLAVPTYTEAYPYDELVIASTPPTRVRDTPAGFNVGGRLDYRFGRSRRFGAGLQVLYSTASVKLQAAPEATEASFDAGGLSLGAGVRVYF